MNADWQREIDREIESRNATATQSMAKLAVGLLALAAAALALAVLGSLSLMYVMDNPQLAITLWSTPWGIFRFILGGFIDGLPILLVIAFFLGFAHQVGGAILRWLARRARGD